MKKYNVVIVGCGNIGALKPDKYDRFELDYSLTHANAVSRNKQLTLLGLVDRSDNALLLADQKWDPIKVSNSLIEFNQDRIDIVVISSPTETHLEMIKVAASMNPKLIIVEKPFCSDSKQAIQALDLCTRENIKLMVNFTRAFVPFYNDIRLTVRDEQPIECCRLLYNRGIKREGCHFLQLAIDWFGEGKVSSVLNYSIHDYSKLDPTLAVLLKFDKCPIVTMTPVDGRRTSVFEIDLITNQRRIILLKHGRLFINSDIEGEWFVSAAMEKEDMYGDYRSLALFEGRDSCRTTDLEYSLSYLYDSVIESLENKRHSDQTAIQAIKVHRLLEEIIRKGAFNE